MSSFKEKAMKNLIKELNDRKIIQDSCDWRENIPDDLWDKIGNFKSVESGLDVDKHRWYETSVEVLDTGNGFIGVKSITDLFSESSSYSDIELELCFFEMEEIQITTYRNKK